MTSLEVDQLVLDPVEYARLRPQRRQLAIALRRSRRVHVGDLLTFEFENAQTLGYQAQEMLYVEKVTDPAVAAEEISVYQRLLPRPSSLTATMMIEIPDQQQVRAELERLNGLHERVRLEIGDHAAAGEDVPPPDEGPATRTVSVHFLRFELTDEAAASLRDGAPVRLLVDHPQYAASAELPRELTEQLAADMQPDNG